MSYTLEVSARKREKGKEKTKKKRAGKSFLALELDKIYGEKKNIQGSVYIASRKRERKRRKVNGIRKACKPSISRTAK